MGVEALGVGHFLFMMRRLRSTTGQHTNR
jgi:hypothetical protein